MSLDIRSIQNDAATRLKLLHVLQSQSNLWDAMRSLERHVGHELPNLCHIAEIYCDAGHDEKTLSAIVNELELGRPVDDEPKPGNV